MIAHTGVHVSKDHLAIVVNRARGVLATPIVMVSGASLYDDVRQEFGDWLDTLAQGYGLPAPPIVDGEPVHYGITAKGEFTKWGGDDACPPQDILGT